MDSLIYHEKQVKELCALHTLNNLFQKKDTFVKDELDEICYNLSPKIRLNPHKSIFGLGNYDVNVLMAALQNKGYDLIWFDKRKDTRCLVLNNIFGFIMNIPNEYHIASITLPFRRRHWVAIREINGIHYNLDSKSEYPITIGEEEALLTYLNELLKNRDYHQLFIVVTSGNEYWQREDCTMLPQVSNINNCNSHKSINSN